MIWVDEPVDDMSPTARLVYIWLGTCEDPVTQTMAAECTGTSERETRRALKKLADVGVVEEVTMLGDARRKEYILRPRHR